MKLKFIVPYHNNLKDFFNEISKEHECVFFTSSSKNYTVDNSNSLMKLNYSSGRVLGHTILRFNILKVINNIDSKDDYVFVKHLFQPINWLFFIICKIKGVGVCVYHQNYRYIPLPVKYLLKLLFWFICPRNFKGFAITKAGQNQVKNYTYEATYLPIPIKEEKFKNRTKKRKSSLNIICVARLSQKRKNHELLIESLEQFKQQHPNTDVNLTLVGKASENNYYRKLNNRINNSSISDNILIKENIPYKKMKQIYENYDLLVLPAKSEPLGFVVVEAMAAGLPVICSNECGAKSYINEGQNGYVFNLKEGADLLNCLNNFIKNNSINWKKINEFGKKSLQKIKEGHDPKENVAKLTRLLTN